VKGDTTYETSYTLEILNRASGIIKKGIDLLLDSRNMVFCLTRPPGHHSCEDKRAGFCHRNFAIEALDYLDSHGKKALILDIDAHHGDGTESEIVKRLYGTFISIHGFGKHIYPETGNVSIPNKVLNIPLPPSTTSDEWLHAFHTRIIPEIQCIKPDVIILSCGLDGHHKDQMMPLQLTEDTYSEFGKHLCSLNIPVLSILEGGYCIPVLGKCVENIIRHFTPFTI
jgi:acetoin utilization deacetylase AcuC-like enzyme